MPLQKYYILLKFHEHINLDVFEHVGCYEQKYIKSTWKNGIIRDVSTPQSWEIAFDTMSRGIGKKILSLSEETV